MKKVRLIPKVSVNDVANGQRSLAETFDAASGIPIMDSNAKIQNKNLNIESTISGNADKIPTSKAVSDALGSVSSFSIDFTNYGTARYINTDTQIINKVKLINTGEVKLWENGVNILTIPSQENVDSGTIYTYTLPTPHTIAADTKVWWTIERDADNATERLLSIY